MKKTIFAAGLAGLSLFALATPSLAVTHPRRAEVNARLANQDRRIHRERKEGDITAAQAKDLHQEDHGIRADERFDASNDNGHITKAEQHSLNQQENSVSQQIGH
jgi:hypothetical protein